MGPMVWGIHSHVSQYQYHMKITQKFMIIVAVYFSLRLRIEIESCKVVFYESSQR